MRGYDALTGALRWSGSPLTPAPNQRTGAGNAWSVMTVDPQRHLVFVPTGSASPDYYGGLRPGDDKWADSVVALDSRTGRLVWGFQLVHHDLWDYDTAASPLLAEIPHGAPYGMLRRFLFAGPSDSPCAKPPWGELLAVDLAKGVVRWRRPLGTMAEINPALDQEGLGSISLGGTIATAGGLTFIGGTMDRLPPR